MTIDQNLRLLPSIDDLLQSTMGQRLIAEYSRAMTLRALRATLDQARMAIRNGSPCPSSEELLVRAEQTLQREQQPHLRPVINATGVIINTNLGRAPLSQAALLAVQQVAGEQRPAYTESIAEHRLPSPPVIHEQSAEGIEFIHRPTVQIPPRSDGVVGLCCNVPAV